MLNERNQTPRSFSRFVGSLFMIQHDSKSQCLNGLERHAEQFGLQFVAGEGEIEMVRALNDVGILKVGNPRAKSSAHAGRINGVVDR
jgi:hypothetical protein